MNRFLLILSDKRVPDLDATYEKTLAALRSASLPTLPIRPHMILFQNEGNLDLVARIVSQALPDQHHNWLVLEIGREFRGASPSERIDSLTQFFSPTN